MSEYRWDPEQTGDLVARLQGRGVKMQLVEGRLEIDAPAGVLTEADREQLERRRLDLVAWCRGERGTGVRGLPGGRIAWKLTPPQEPARDEWALEEPYRW